MKRVDLDKLSAVEMMIYEFKCPCCKEYVRSEDDPNDFVNEKGTKEDDAELYTCPECGEDFIIIERRK